LLSPEGCPEATDTQPISACLHPIGLATEVAGDVSSFSVMFFITESFLQGNFSDAFEQLLLFVGCRLQRPPR